MPLRRGETRPIVLARRWLGPRALRIETQAQRRETHMLHWAVIFFVIALIAAVLGQRGVAGLSAQIGYLFVGVAVIFLVVALLTGRGPVVGP
jgi:uncharacterized membrane protein YtjA (UPF0391 family)